MTTSDKPMVMGREVNGMLRHHLLAIINALPGISEPTARELLCGRPDLASGDHRELRSNLWAGSDPARSIQGYIRGGWVTRDKKGGLHPTTKTKRWIDKLPRHSEWDD